MILIKIILKDKLYLLLMISNDISLDDLDINNIKSVNLGLVCIKSNYYNEKNVLDFDCYHTCIIEYKNSNTRYIKMTGSFIYDNLFHLLSNKDKEHLHIFIKPLHINNKNINKIVDNIVNNINDDDIIKLSRSYLNDEKKTVCYNCWSCLC